MPSKPMITSFCENWPGGGVRWHATSTSDAAAAITDAVRNRMFMVRRPLYPSWMRALGVDYGRQRIGLALSDASGTLARPWKTIARIGNPSQVARAIAAEVTGLEEEGEPVGVIVLGFPRRLNGAPNEQTVGVEQLATELRATIALPLALQDERLSSREAESLLARRERDWRKRKAQLDAMAAAVILQDYLDANARQAAGPEDIDR